MRFVREIASEIASKIACVNGPWPFHSQEWSMSNFSCSLTNNSTSHSMENLPFHNSLRWKMIALPILTTSLIHFLFKRFGECTFWELGSERVKFAGPEVDIKNVTNPGLAFYQASAFSKPGSRRLTKPPPWNLWPSPLKGPHSIFLYSGVTQPTPPNK